MKPKFQVWNVIQHTSFPLLWELDQVQPSSKCSKEEQAYETHFIKHVKRDNSGRYTVKLPFNEKLNQIGELKKIAYQRFYSIEKKFEKYPSLKDHYSTCLDNYSDEGHMSEVRDKNDKRLISEFPAIATHANSQGEHNCFLICVKSRVASLKVVSLPKLELCASLLLAKFCQSTIQSLKMSINKTFFWSDSTITLIWICQDDNHWPGTRTIKSVNSLKTIQPSCALTLTTLTK